MRHTTWSGLLGAASVFALCAGANAQELPFDGVVSFGDSLSDSGEENSTFAITSGLAAAGIIPPEGVSPFAPFGYFNGQFSDGDVWATVLADEIFGVSNRQNFAFGGARSVDNSASGDFIPDIAAQVDLFLSQDGQIGPNELVTLWIGANDLNGVTNPADLSPTIAGAVGEIGTAIGTLGAVGAETILLANIPDLGVIPLVTAPAAALNDPSIISDASTAAALFNDALESNIAGFEAASGANVILFDVAGLFDALVANPGAFGFTNITDACVNATGSAGSGLPFLPGGSAGGPTGACPTNADGSIDSTGFNFFDLLHPTAQSHRALASFANGTLTSAILGDDTVAVQSQISQFNVRTALRSVDQRLFERRAGVTLAETFGDGASDAAKALGVAGRRGFDAYGSFNYGIANRDAQNAIAGYDADGIGTTVGVDYTGKHALIGFNYTYASTEADLDTGGETEVTSHIIAAYAGVNFRKDIFGLDMGLFGDVQAGVSIDDYEVERATGFDLAPFAEADFAGETYFVKATSGAEIPLGDIFRLSSTGYITVLNGEIDAYEETGFAPLTLSVEEQDYQNILLGGDWALGAALGPIFAQARVGYEQDLGDDGDEFILRTGSETVTGSNALDDSGAFIGGATITAALGSNMQLMADYRIRSTFGTGSDHNFAARFAYAF